MISVAFIFVAFGFEIVLRLSLLLCAFSFLRSSSKIVNIPCTEEEGEKFERKKFELPKKSKYVDLFQI